MKKQQMTSTDGQDVPTPESPLNKDTEGETSAGFECMQLAHFVDCQLEDALYWTREDGKFLYVNDAACRNLGYSKAELLTMGVHDIDATAVEGPEWGRRLMEIQGKGSDRVERVHRRKDGTVFPVEIKRSYFEVEGQNIICGIAHDISKREQSRRFLRLVLDSIPIRVFWKDCQGNYLGGNRSFSEDAGLGNVDEIEGKTDFEMPWAAKEAEAYRGDDQLVIETGLSRLGFEESQSHSGGVHLLRTNKVALRDNDRRIVGVLGTYEDISKQKRAELELQRLYTAIEQSQDTIMVTDLEGRVEYVNPVFELVSGYSCEEVIGRRVSFLNRDPEAAAERDRELWSALRRGESWEGHFYNKRKDGTFYTEKATISPVRDDHGVVVNYVAVKRDITEELARDERLRQVQKMESIGRLAGGVAHDFNNILHTVSGFSELILMDAPEMIPQHVREIQQVVGHAAEITKQLLAFSKKRPIQYLELDLNGMIRSARKMLMQAINPRIAFALDLSSELLMVSADASQILQVVMNLVVNARDAMPDGGRIRLITEKRIVPASFQLNPEQAVVEEFACITVTDNGSGMNEGQLQHLFEPFFTTKPEGQGTGLGLSVVYGIIKDHGGWVDVHSTPGEGTTFDAYIPMQISDDCVC